MDYRSSVVGVTWLIAMMLGFLCGSVDAGAPTGRPLAITDDGIVIPPIPTLVPTTIATLPASATDGTRYTITDGIHATDCTVGDPEQVLLEHFVVDCAYHANAAMWEAVNTKLSLQHTQEQGVIGGFTHLTSARPLLVWPGHRVLGPDAPRLEYYDESGHIRKRCTFGPDPREDCDPEEIHLPVGGIWSITWAEGVARSVLGSIENVDGVQPPLKTGIFEARSHSYFFSCNDGTTADPQYLLGGSRGASNCASSDTSNMDTQLMLTRGGTLTNLTCFANVLPPAGESIVFTVRHAVTNTGVSCTITDTSLANRCTSLVTAASIGGEILSIEANLSTDLTARRYFCAVENQF